MSASHNPGGPKEDWGIKFNYSGGEPAPEKITDAIYGYTQKISEIKTADVPDVDLSKLGSTSFGDFEVGGHPPSGRRAHALAGHSRTGAQTGAQPPLQQASIMAAALHQRGARLARWAQARAWRAAEPPLAHRWR